MGKEEPKELEEEMPPPRNPDRKPDIFDNYELEEEVLD